MTCEDILLLRESADVEAKKAHGRDGMGAVPDSVWSTYSAMANSSGGIIVLGAKERDNGSLEIIGVNDPYRVLKDFWNTINNPTKISQNILADSDVQIIPCNGRRIITISVPRATRGQRPVFVGANPFTGTYRRHFEGDYRCEEATVRRMIADATQETRDDTPLEGFDLPDLDQASFAAYRNEFRSTRPGHPWITLGDQELLEQLGGWKRDRNTGISGLTTAGLLMFGQLRSILDAFPNYILDYQEKPEDRNDDDQRWLDRITTDGTWSGNLYEFYRKVYPKLTSDLRIPFQLRDGHKRLDETHVHEGLREALVNTIIHADYAASTAISIRKFPHKFVFINPGGLRLPLDVILAGGTSDCRNRNLQKMFQMIGAVEQAGSGVPKILRAWREQDWQRPAWYERWNPDQTQLDMGMHSLLPPAVVEALRAEFGEQFERLDNNKRLAVVIARAEGFVTNQRLQAVTELHPSDITRALKELVAAKMLVKDGEGRGSSYTLTGPEEQVSLFNKEEKSSQVERAAPETIQARPDVEQAKGANQQPPYPPEVMRVRKAGRVDQATMESAILTACNSSFRTAQELATILNRSRQTLRAIYLPSLVKGGKLQLRYPDNPSHPSQAYISTSQNN